MGDHQIFSFSFLIPSLWLPLLLYTFSYFPPFFCGIFFCRVLLIRNGFLPVCLPHKVGGYISLGREIWTQESNWNDAVNGIYGLCAFYYYATSILFSLSLSLPVCNFPTFSTFGHFITRRGEEEVDHKRRTRRGWPTDAKHRLYYPLSPFRYPSAFFRTPCLLPPPAVTTLFGQLVILLLVTLFALH